MAELLNEQQIGKFRADGFLVCPGFLAAAELEHVRQWMDDVGRWAQDPAAPGQHYFEKTASGPALARSEAFAAHHRGFHELLVQGRLISVLGQLFGESAILFKEKINYKLPGGGGFAPHQDAAAYRFGSLHITCLLAADPCTQENGCLYFASGRQAEGLIALDDAGCMGREAAESMNWTAAEMPAGGAVFFDSFVPHYSQANHSALSRRAVYATYIKAAEGDLRDAYYQDRQEQLAQLQQERPGTRRISTIGHFQGELIE